jgi:hypothetical protein
MIIVFELNNNYFLNSLDPIMSLVPVWFCRSGLWAGIVV